LGDHGSFRKVELKRGADPRFALNRNVAPHCFSQPLGDRQTKPSTRHLPLFSAQAIKRLEQVLNLLGGDTLPRVLDREPAPFFMLGKPDVNTTSGPVVLDGVAQQVQENLFCSDRIGERAYPRFGLVQSGCHPSALGLVSSTIAKHSIASSCNAMG
jgi:hypothetical protein